MKMTKASSKIEGLQCTAIEIDLLGTKTLKTKTMLLRDPAKHEGLGAGQYNKDRDWPPDVVNKLDALIDAVEEAVLVELFDVQDNRRAGTGAPPMGGGKKKDDEQPLAFPTIGGGTGTRQP